MAEEVKEKIMFLLPVDYSDASRKAAVYALRLAERLHAGVEFFHVYYSPVLDLVDITEGTFAQNTVETDAVENLAESEKNAMQGFVLEILGRHPVEVTIIQTVVPGIPEDEIVDYAQLKNPDLVVMGTRGKNVQKVAIFGSVTVSVMERIQTPLLIIPENYTPATQEEPDKIVYVTSFDNADFGTIDHLMKLLAPFKDMRLDCVHLETSPGNTWDEIKLGGLVEYIKKKYEKEQVNYTSISDKNLLPELDAYISQRGSNVIAMTAQRKGLIAKLFAPNISRKLLYHSTIPLFIFHP